MAEIVLTDTYVTIGGDDVSDHVESINLEFSSDAVELTAMGASTRTRAGGLKDWSVSLTLNQDYANGDIDDILFAAVGTVVAFVGKPNGSSTSTSNPSYSGNALLVSYQPISGSVGEKASTTVELQAAGDLTRAES